MISVTPASNHDGGSPAETVIATPVVGCRKLSRAAWSAMPDGKVAVDP